MMTKKEDNEEESRVDEDNGNEGNENEAGNETHIAIFSRKSIRKTWFAERWWFVIEDVILVLTDSSDAKQYIQKLKQRDEVLAKGGVQIVRTLLINTTGGKQHMNCADTEGIFRIIQSIPSIVSN